MKKGLDYVNDDCAFWLNLEDFNPVACVKSIKELIDALNNAPVEVIAHHVSDDKNDFAMWIELSIGDKKLADNVKKLKAKNLKSLKEKIVKAIDARIKELEKSEKSKAKKKESSKKK